MFLFKQLILRIYAPTRSRTSVSTFLLLIQKGEVVLGEPWFSYIRKVAFYPLNYKGLLLNAHTRTRTWMPFRASPSKRVQYPYAMWAWYNS